MAARDHHEDCEWHLDQYDWECTCGATRPKAPWFDEQVARAQKIRAENSVNETPKVNDAQR